MQEETCPWPLSPPVPELTDEPSDWVVLAALPADTGTLQPDPVPVSVGNGVFRAGSSADACSECTDVTWSYCTATLKPATFLLDLCLEGSVEVLTLKKHSLGVKCN